MKLRSPRLVQGACVLTLVSLALISFGIVHPTPLAVIAAMSVGQGIGTIGALLFALVALRDLMPIFRAKATADAPDPPAVDAPVVTDLVAPKSEPGKDNEPAAIAPQDSLGPTVQPKG